MESVQDPLVVAKVALRLRHDKKWKDGPDDPAAKDAARDSSTYHYAIMIELKKELDNPSWYPYTIELSERDLWIVVIGERLNLDIEGLRKQRRNDLIYVSRWLKLNMSMFPVDHNLLKTQLGIDEEVSFDFLSSPLAKTFKDNAEIVVSAYT